MALILNFNSLPLQVGSFDGPFRCGGTLGVHVGVVLQCIETVVGFELLSLEGLANVVTHSGRMLHHVGFLATRYLLKLPSLFFSHLCAYDIGLSDSWPPQITKFPLRNPPVAI